VNRPAAAQRIVVQAPAPAFPLTPAPPFPLTAHHGQTPVTCTVEQKITVTTTYHLH
jgi:hypothetical protein